MIESNSKRARNSSIEILKLLAVVLIVLSHAIPNSGDNYCGVNLIIHDRYYYTQLTGFICIYFIVAYMKYYMPEFVASNKKNMQILSGAVAGLLGSILILDIVGLKISLLSNYLTTWSIIINPVMILIALSAFNLCNKYNFYSKTVNYLSSLSLLIYMIHANRIVMNYLKMNWFEKIYATYGYGHITLWVGLCGSVLLIGSLVLAIAYKEIIQNLYRRIYKKLIPYLELSGKKIINLLLQIK